MTSQQRTITTDQRVVRVFVSSTFRDMHAEREELIKRTFPQLRKLCEERGVTWGEVDLRWGITQEQAERGEVLPICLEEIYRCRPYFIGLLAERYGWVPDHIPLSAAVLLKRRLDLLSPSAVAMIAARRTHETSDDLEAGYR